MTPARPTGSALLAFGLAYAAAVALGEGLGAGPRRLAAFWPPSGLLVAMLILRRPGAWPWYLATALAADLVAAVWSGPGWALAGLASWSAEAAEACVGAALVRRFVAQGYAPATSVRVIGLAVLAASLVAALGAALGVRWLLAVRSDITFGPAWQAWWVADTLGVLVVTPLILGFAGGSALGPHALRPWRVVEFILVLGALLAAAWIAFGSPSPPSAPAWRFPYLVISPFLVWIGIRFSPSLTSVASCSLVLVATWQTSRARGPFAWAPMTANDRTILLQMFLAACVLAPLILASICTARRRGERGLREVERRFRAIFDHSMQFLAILTPDGTVLDVNKIALDLVHCGLADVAGQPFWETPWWAARPDFQGQVKLAIAEAAAGRMSRFEAEHQGIGGDVIIVDFSLKPFRGEDGRVSLLIAEGRDITDRVRAEQLARSNESLTASEAGLRQLADAMPQIVWMADAAGSLDYYNERWYEFTGFAREGMGDESWKPILHPDDFQDCFDLWYEAVRTGQPYQNEFRYVDRATGQYRWHLGRAMPVRDESGRVVRWFGTSTDINTRKQVEDELRLLNETYERRVEERTAELANALADQERTTAALRVSEEQFRGAFDASAIGMALVATDGRWLQVNRSLCRIVGYTEAELLAKTFQDITHPDDLDADLDQFRRVLAGDLLMYQLEKRYFHKDGRIIWIVLNVSLVRDAGGKPVHFVAQIEDFTARKRSEEELCRTRDAAMAATKAKAEFLANMSHEIRTPMNGVLGMAELTLDTGLSRRQREYVEAIKSSAEGLLTIIGDILDFSKVEAGKLDLDHVPFDVRTALEEALGPLAIRAQAKGLELCARVATGVPGVVIGDPLRLRQVLVNLIGNAIKFTAAGEVSVAVDLVPGVEGAVPDLLFSVADTGIGIPASRRAAIFEPFEQVDGSTTRNYGGTGLGLAISTQLVGLMGGRIWVEENVPHGSIFRFAARFARPTTGEPTPVRRDAEIGGGRVLVVEPNATSRRNLVEMLSSWGLTPTSVAGALAAVAALDEACAGGDPFRAVLIAGEEQATRIVARPGAAGAAIVLLVGPLDGPPTLVGPRELDLVRLTKPVRASELFDTLARLTGPAEATAGDDPAGDAPALEGPAGPRRVLVAEDNRINQIVALRMLESLGHRPTAVADGKAALAALEEEPFDLVLMDVQMPVMDGFQAVAALRARERGTGRHLPVVALTAHAMKGDRERCLDAGFDDYLTKPVRVEGLRDVLKWSDGSPPLRDEPGTTDSPGRPSAR